MLGLIIAAIYGTIIYFLGEPSALAQSFLSATSFLFWWYVVTCSIQAILVLFVFLGFIGGATYGGSQVGGFFGGILGFFTGGAFSVLLLIIFTIHAACFIVGAYLLNHSLTLQAEGPPLWNNTKLLIGGLLVLLGFIMSKGSSKHSKRD